jgi:Flp pilus assembly protein TadG
MSRKSNRRARRGNVLVLTALFLVPIFAFVAMAVDLGLVALAQTQCQNAADLAALTGVRTVNGNAQNNFQSGTATSNAVTAAGNNYILSKAVDDDWLTIQLGTYSYDSTQQKFVANVGSVPNGQPPTLVKATVNYTGNYAFARALGMSGFNLTSTAIAVHRPRDISIVLDFSGSMNNESDLWNCETYLGTWNGTPNNPESVYPLFGHYSSASANLQQSSGNPLVGTCNISTSVLGMPPLVNDFVSSNRGVQPSTSAFTSAPDSYATVPAGDNYLLQNLNTGGSYAQTVADFNNGSTAKNATFESKGYAQYTGQASNGYTEGPRYWGKSFFIWPPDPKNDWRVKFFGTNDNTKLWDAGGNWRTPTAGGYTINYAAILNWIQNTGPNPFPSQLRAPRITYYASIPSDVPASAYNYANANEQIGNNDQRFWKEFIDFALGVWMAPGGATQTPGNPSCSYGPDFTWGTVQVSAPPGGASPKYMNYLDNPLRPRHRFWFGPMTMIQFILDAGIAPGTAHDISMFAAKMGIQAALQDIQTNHPNDLVALLLFSRPHFNGEPTDAGAFNSAQFSLGNDYSTMMNGLWYAPNSSTADIAPWDPNGLQCPHSHGDYDSNTTSNYGFMLAHNEFVSSSTAMPTGGNGRNGANRLVIFETDGMANCAADGGGTWDGTDYNIGGSSPINQWSGMAADQAVYTCARRLTALTTDNTNGPGFSTPSKPVIIHCIAFGAIFQTTAPASATAPAVTLLQTVSNYGQTTFPSSASDPTNGYKWCIGTLGQRQAKLQQAFQTIINGGVGVSLIQ